MKSAGPLFRPVKSTQFPTAVKEFLDAPEVTAVPVPVEGREDLAQSVELAAGLYSTLGLPHPLDHGVLLGAEQLLDGVADLVRPLARTWLAEGQLADAPAFLRDHPGALLLVGCYDRLTLDPVRSLLLATYRSRTHALTLLSGRDAASLAWSIAKQYARPDAEVAAVGLFTDTDRPPHLPGVQVFDDRDFERVDIRSAILDGRWRKVAFQGHGKDDSVNLGEFTICGLNPTAPARPGLLGPRCAYGLPCYKPEDKLVPLHRVPAVEVVLSACNSGPLADLALYDPKYQLLLNALDGPARTVVAAVSVHDSDRPENVAWMRSALTGGDTVDTLNASLAGSHPYPAFLRFGLPEAAATAATAARPAFADHRPDPLLLTVGRRLTALLGSELLPHNHALRPRLTKLARKVDLWVARPTHLADRSAEEILASLTADLQSLDHVIAGQVAANPEDELMNYPAHFGDRSSLDPEVREVTCHCGRPSQEFTRRGLLPNVLDTTCAVCMRCGDVTFRLPEAPALLAYSADEVRQGEVLEVRAALTAARGGPVRLGLFVPSYLREEAVVEPELAKVRAAGGQSLNVRFRIHFAPDTAPQAYYFTVFAVQDLAVSTARRHFGVLPR